MDKKMTTETMLVHKALAELKILDARIINEIEDGTFCIANQHSNQKIKGVAVGDYKRIMQGDYDKVSDLIKRRKAIKQAVVLSNAVTKVVIGDKEYTVAEAIEMKNHGINSELKLLKELKAQYGFAQRTISDKNGESLEKSAENYVIGLYGSKDGKTNVEEYEKTKKAFIESRTYDLIDPIDILEEINGLQDYIDSFTSEVDAALSVSNAITEITIEY